MYIYIKFILFLCFVIISKWSPFDYVPLIAILLLLHKTLSREEGPTFSTAALSGFQQGTLGSNQDKGKVVTA